MRRLSHLPKACHFLIHSLFLPLYFFFSPFSSSLSCADHALRVLSTSFNVMQLSFEEST